MSETTVTRMESALAQAAQGDASAFASIVREHQAMVFSVAFHFFHDRPLAEDMAQEVFLHLYQNMRSIHSAAHLKFWLRKVAGHRCIDQARAHRPSLSLDEIPEPVALNPARDPVFEQRIQQLIASLPGRARLVVIFRFQEELEYHEIAEIMEMPINTVKSNLQRALAILRGKLARCMGDVPV